MLRFIALCAVFISLFVLMYITSEYLRASTLKEMGYEAKVINLNCYAKYHGKWTECVDVLYNETRLK